MLKSSLILIFLLFIISIASGQPDKEDYDVYSALIKREIIDSAKSVSIIKRLEIETESPWIKTDLQSNNMTSIYILTKTANGESMPPPFLFDSTIKQLIIKYCDHQADGLLLAEHFNLKPKIFLIEKFPIRTRKVENGWKRFYKKHPGSGGIFTFSRILFSEDRKTAVFYHSRRRHGLSGHGALSVMEKINGEWKIKYDINLWYN